MDYQESPVVNPCFMRRYVDGKIIFLDESGNMTYDDADIEFYRHRHIEEQNNTRPATELSENDIALIKCLADLESGIVGMDVIAQFDGDLIIALTEQPASAFRIRISDLDKLIQEQYIAELYDFTASRSIDEPYSIQFEGDDLVVY